MITLSSNVLKNFKETYFPIVFFLKYVEGKFLETPQIWGENMGGLEWVFIIFIPNLSSGTSMEEERTYSCRSNLSHSLFSNILINFSFLIMFNFGWYYLHTILFCSIPLIQIVSHLHPKYHSHFNNIKN